MPATSKGLPYPAATAAPNVPADLQALAQSLDFSLIPLLTPAQIPSVNTLLSAYPLGISMVRLLTADATAGGWPGGVSGQVLTVKPATDRAAQLYYRNSTVTVQAFYRQLVADPGPHTPWAGASSSYSQYVNQFTLSGATNPTAAKVVTYPAGRFTTPPNVTVSSSNLNWHVGASTTLTSASVTARYIVSVSSDPIITIRAEQALSTQASTDPPPALLSAPSGVLATRIVTCSTPGCGNSGIPLEVPAEIDFGDGPVPVEDGVCGVCLQPLDMSAPVTRLS